MYLLDTDTASLFLRGNPVVTARVLEATPTDIWLSIVTVEEMLRGRLVVIRKSQSPNSSTDALPAYSNLEKLIAALSAFQIRGYTKAADAIFKAFPSDVRKIGQMDRRIGAIAIAGNLVLVTANTSHFEKIPDLKIEDWSV